MSRPQRGELWLADLDSANPQLARGQLRPVLVLQTNSLNNAGHPTTIVVPGSPFGHAPSDGDNFPLRLRLPRAGGMSHDTDLMIDQVRAVVTGRLLQRVHIVPPLVVGRVEQAVVLLTGP
jgi:mRNA interferase MazF